ncbi:LapA family protein [Peribacillus glennii]|uniref:DUF1049 domain-containing protein n=1 Tax=Peribacillus glennii TaxID=2303991 RepID=A0A372LHQ3_9BACI|nr:lipopolysaccharide assembly protein LapA domain-containing protein [Peribacillus glennii]RFU65837.1 DUF1049 domain-containing protein [Peribacillus glennii]
MKFQWIFLIGIIFAIIVSFFAVINVDPVTVNYFFGKAEWPLILVVLGSVLMGGFIVFSINAVKILSLKRKIAKLERIIEELESKPVPGLADEQEIEKSQNLNFE